MSYTVKQLADLAGVSARTLRYYDQIGLLKPEAVNHSGYRLYNSDQVDRLQQILFYKEMGLSLKAIQDALSAPAIDLLDVLMNHRRKLVNERQRLNRLIATVEKTIAAKKGDITMTDSEKFEGFKQEMLDQNEAQYGQEIREKYGEETVRKSNEAFKNMSKEDYEQSVQIQEEMFRELKQAMKDGDPAGEAGQKAAALHKKWLGYFWGFYSKEAHAGLAQMYVDDSRFTQYYDDSIGKGAAKMLRDAVQIFTSAKNH